MDDETRAAVVTTSAEIEVIRQSVAFLMMRELKRSPPDEREAILAEFETEISEIPPGYGLPNPSSTRLYEEIAAAAPARSAEFVRLLRRLLA